MKRYLIFAFLLIFSACSRGTVNLNRVRGIRGEYAPVVKEDGFVTFSVYVPEATYVTIAGNFNGWNPQATPLNNDENGVWSITLDLVKSKKYYYKFLIDGFWIADPDNPDTTPDGFGGMNSVVIAEMSTD